MIKYVCDHCKGDAPAAQSIQIGAVMNMFHLCQSCFLELERWLNVKNA